MIVVNSGTSAAEQTKAYMEANLNDGNGTSGVQENALILKAWGNKPTVDIPLDILTFGNDGGGE